VRARIEAWISQTDADFAVATHGYRLDASEQRRRCLLLSLLEGAVDREAYRDRFGGDVLADFPELGEAVAHGLIDDSVRLTELGRERSDVLGHWLQSEPVRAARAAWTAA
jgi:oxygen-independent coproporphyrinogen-3 oxidase